MVTVYVALSRVRSLDGLELLAPLRSTEVKTSAAVTAYDNAFAPSAPGLPRRRSLGMDDLASLGGGWWQQGVKVMPGQSLRPLPVRVVTLAGSRKCSLGAQPCGSGICGRPIAAAAGTTTNANARPPRHKCSVCEACGIYSGVSSGYVID